MAYIQNEINYTGPGIYMLRGVNNSFVYIGSAKNIRSRIKTHNQALKKSNGQSKHMRAKLAGDEVFEAVILEKISPKHSLYYLNSREAYYIKQYNACGENGLNSATVNDRLEKDIKFIEFSLSEFKKRASENAQKGTQYTDFLVGVTENNMRLCVKYLQKGLRKIEEVC